MSKAHVMKESGMSILIFVVYCSICMRLFLVEDNFNF